VGETKRLYRNVPERPPHPPRVSVVVPTYNYGRFLPGCVESALSQPGVDVDVLVVDDASTDGTATVIADLVERHPEVRAVQHATNQGHIASFNEGLFGVDGTYVVKLDADDLLPPGALGRATALLETHPEVGLVYGRPVHFEDAAPARPPGPARSWSIWWGRDWVANRCRRGCNTISNPEVVMRTEIMRKAGGQKASVPHTSDLELWLEMASLADVGRVNGPVQGYYRVHASSMQRTVHAGKLQDISGVRDAFDVAFAGAAGTLPGAEELHATARRRVAQRALDLACRAYERGKTEVYPVDDLVALALATWPEAAGLPEWRALERRRRIGADRAPKMPHLVARALLRRAEEEINLRRWHVTGLL
jgi:Glycosyl transferase family 2